MPTTLISPLFTKNAGRQSRWKAAGLLCMLLCFLPRLEAQTPFTSLESGFTQSLYGNGSTFFGGVAFTSTGDVWVDQCNFSGSLLTRFASGTTMPDGHGGVEHAQTSGSPFNSNAGCGLTNHPDGTLYSNTSAGLVNLDPNTGAQLRSLGPAGNALGIAVDPQTKNILYVGGDCLVSMPSPTCSIISIDPVSLSSSNFVVLPSSESQLVDGIMFDPTGNFLFVANRKPSFRLTILNRAGSVVQDVPMTSEPDGIAFHTNPIFAVTNNTDGTMTRFDFPGNDFTQPPTQTQFAAGGFRGDLGQVGPDGCLYLSQDGTRFADNSTSGNNSVIRICSNFVPAPGTVPLFAYVSNENSNDVSVVNVANNTVLATIPVGAGPVAFAQLPGQSLAYVANFNASNVSVVNTATNSVTGSIAVGKSPIGIAVNSNGSTAYVANFNKNTISVIDTASSTVTATIAAKGQPSALALSPDGSSLYVLNFTTNKLQIMSTATNTITNSVAAGAEPVALAVTPDGSRVYVADLSAGLVTVINPGTATVIGTITVGTFPSGLAVTPDGQSVYVSNQGSSTVTVIQTSNNTVSATIPGFSGPIGVAITPDGTTAYVTNSTANTLSAISTSTNTVSTTIPVKAHPFGVAVTPLP